MSDINHAAKVREARNRIDLLRQGASIFDDYRFGYGSAICEVLGIFDESILPHLDALEAERDEARNDVESARKDRRIAWDDANKAEAERDALTARIAELEAALTPADSVIRSMAAILRDSKWFDQFDDGEEGKELCQKSVDKTLLVICTALTDRGASGGGRCGTCNHADNDGLPTSDVCQKCNRNMWLQDSWLPKPTPSGAEETTR